ncbi:MAG: hypothetical protein EBS23_00820 [Betaproteobacteria bacterium]|nr:hypothetical protein [Betaproteobacteria bacterium]
MIRADIRLRRAKAQVVIDAYCDTPLKRAQHEALIDVLADLMHWTDGKKLDFQNALRHAQSHHDAEVQP